MPDVNPTIQPQSILTRSMILMGLFSTLCASGYSDDHGSTPETATLISVGESVSGSHETPGDTDFFKFFLSAGRLYRIETFDLDPPGHSDTVIILYDYDTQEQTLSILAENDQGGSEPNASKILWPSTADEMYYLEVFQFLGSVTGDYKLIVEDTGPIPDDDHGDTPAEATLLPVDGGPVAGQFELPADIDFFRFSAIQDLFYDLQTLNLGDETDTVLALFAPDGESLLAEDHQGGVDFNASRIIFQATATDTHYARVTHFLPTGTGCYEIKVTLKGAAKELIPDSTPLAGWISRPGEIDIYRMAAHHPHLYEFKLVTDNLFNRFEMLLLGPDGRSTLHTQGFVSDTILWAAPQTAPFYVVIRENVTGGSFDLSVSDLGSIPPDADLNRDGIVDAADLLLLISRWKEVIPTPTP